MTRGRKVLALVVGVLVLGSFTAAFASWTQGTSRAQSITLARFSPDGSAVAAPTLSTSGATVTITPNTVTLGALVGAGSRPAITVSSWTISRSGLSASVFSCTGSSCTDTVSASGSYSYTVTPKYLGWTGTPSQSGSVDVTVPSAAVLKITGQTGTRSSSFKGTETFSGTGSTSGTITVTIYDGSGCTGSTLTNATLPNPSAGTWGPTGASGEVDKNANLSARATQGSNTSDCFDFKAPNFAR